MESGGTVVQVVGDRGNCLNKQMKWIKSKATNKVYFEKYKENEENKIIPL